MLKIMKFHSHSSVELWLYEPPAMCRYLSPMYTNSFHPACAGVCFCVSLSMLYDPATLALTQREKERERLNKVLASTPLLRFYFILFLSGKKINYLNKCQRKAWN